MAQIAAFTGQSFDAIRDGMSWPDYLNLLEVWSDWPPLPVAVAISAGISPQQRAAADGAPNFGVTSDEAFAELVGMIGTPPPQD